MNFLMLRSSNQTAASDVQPAKDLQIEGSYVSKAAIAMESLNNEEPSPASTSSEAHNTESDEKGGREVSDENSHSQVGSHTDVTEENGFVIIPNNEIPENWTKAPDIHSFHSLDRNFVFPGEQIRILACLSAYKQDTEIITPFKIAAIMNKNGTRKTSENRNGNVQGETNSDCEMLSSVDLDEQQGDTVEKRETNSDKDVSSGESLLRMEDHKRQTDELLLRFKDSHFFARIAELSEPLWSRRKAQDAECETSPTFEEHLAEESSDAVNSENPISAVIDRGLFDARTSGGLARGAVECCSLSNGDIVVLLEVNVGVRCVRDPILEILQFEKCLERKPPLDKQIPSALNKDPCGELLNWLLPVDNSVSPPPRPISPPTLTSISSIRSTPTRPTVSGSSGSQLFSFSNFRSYSMSSLPPNVTPPATVTTPNDKPNFEPEDWNQFSFKKLAESGKGGNEGLLSFRGVPLPQERFSVQCGLEGIFTPGRRWRRKIKLIQPLEINSYAVDCNADDLICVNVKNVVPKDTPDVVVFVDAITVVFEEASKGGPPLYLPIACIEPGNDFTLPNLALRRGEEHSFILKPATTHWKHPKGHTDSTLRPSRSAAGNASLSWHQPINVEGKHGGSSSDQYAVIVSCRCNYTESKLFFKHPTSWRPRISRDLMISVTSEMSREAPGSDVAQLPVQVLTLQASNMTPDNLTLTVLAPASFTSPPSVVPLNPLSNFSELVEQGNFNRQGGIAHQPNSLPPHQGQKVENGSPTVSINPKTLPVSDAVQNSDLGCTHLWLQSRVPLGCVPSQSKATVKLEVLPLTDGIITLDSLRIEVKEKGVTYVPEQSLKIYATSGIATGIS
ncbi:uncharacterized protein LOC127261729 [Andrographis paniculata]|uniref:uncharacterized protein LOC127261729 n=1 Tax=Andrographis paniculata TaxID=175694 RepID=UPI0021E757BD|nr:uncharacterized protein LOC127261729 [Andrographis paniculata]XP_051146034.1 uncharacterized protein LOC127261729 [Andrographis paniculata]